MKILNKLPELLLLVSILFYWYFSTPLNPIAIILVLLVLALIITGKRLLSYVTGVIFTPLSIYMILAVLSEYYEFKGETSEANNLLLTGMLFFSSTFILSTIILLRNFYLTKK